MMSHSGIIGARAAALQSLATIAHTFELTDQELVWEAENVCYHNGLAIDEIGPMLVAFNDLSADQFIALAGDTSFPDAGLQIAAPWS